jgi:predicted Rossmann-fold nucleotide-binding protein
MTKPAAGKTTRWRLLRIVSGGQTGVDRAALDVALELGIPCGGWCPKGRLAEDGRIDNCYPLQEAPTANYAERTALNVRDSDGTLIFARGTLRGGTALTKQLAERYGRPFLVVDPRGETSPARVVEWLASHTIRTLNVAGPRASQRPDVSEQAAAFLRELFAGLSSESPATPPRRRRVSPHALRYPDQS